MRPTPPPPCSRPSTSSASNASRSVPVMVRSSTSPPHSGTSTRSSLRSSALRIWSFVSSVPIRRLRLRPSRLPVHLQRDAGRELAVHGRADVERADAGVALEGGGVGKDDLIVSARAVVEVLDQAGGGAVRRLARDQIHVGGELAGVLQPDGGLAPGGGRR